MPNLCNLRLAIVDDDLDKPLQVPFELIDLVKFPPDLQNRIIGLESHCRNAAVQKGLPFELLSVDINFQDDVDDPVRPMRPKRSEDEGSAFKVADPAIMTASGLYHGMALLARRQTLDEAKNIMPLAWEVRSATPREFANRTDLQNDAVRGYSLLRSMLANPLEDEPLEECVRREFKESHPHRELPAANSLLEVFKADLLSQEISSGSVKDIILKLLPRWRRLLLSAVRDRNIILDNKELERQQKELRALAQSSTPMVSAVFPDSYYVPFQGVGQRETVYGIRLASILADLIAGPGIDVILKTAKLATPGLPKASVVDWFGALVEAAKLGADYSSIMLSVRRDFIQALSRGLVGELWEKHYHGYHNKRLLLYLLMRTHLWLRYPGDPDRQDPVDRVKSDALEPRDSLASIYGFSGANENTYVRPLRENRIIDYMTPTELRQALRRALEYGDGELVENSLWDQWLARGLREFCTDPVDAGGMGYSPAKAALRAPGLFLS